MISDLGLVIRPDTRLDAPALKALDLLVICGGYRTELKADEPLVHLLTDHITHQGTKEAYEGRIATMTPLEAEDIAAAVVYAVTQPLRVNVNEILIRPLDQG